MKLKEVIKYAAKRAGLFVQVNRHCSIKYIEFASWNFKRMSGKIFVNTTLQLAILILRLSVMQQNADVKEQVIHPYILETNLINLWLNCGLDEVKTGSQYSTLSLRSVKHTCTGRTWNLDTEENSYDWFYLGGQQFIYILMTGGVS